MYNNIHAITKLSLKTDLYIAHYILLTLSFVSNQKRKQTRVNIPSSNRINRCSLTDSPMIYQSFTSPSDQYRKLQYAIPIIIRRLKNFCEFLRKLHGMSRARAHGSGANFRLSSPPPFDRTFDITAGVTACPVFIRENSAILTDSRLSRDDALISVSHPRRVVSRSERRPPRPLCRPPVPPKPCVFCYNAPSTRSINARDPRRGFLEEKEGYGLSAESLVHVPAKGRLAGLLRPLPVAAVRNIRIRSCFTVAGAVGTLFKFYRKLLFERHKGIPLRWKHIYDVKMLRYWL